MERMGRTNRKTKSKTGRAAETLRSQANLLDAVEQAVIVTDLDGTIVYWNRFAETLYGWSAPEVIGRNILDITPAMVCLPAARGSFER